MSNPGTVENIEDRPDISVVLPCHNEADAIPFVLPRVEESVRALRSAGHLVEVIVVDDGSKDGSADQLIPFKFARVVRLERNLGYGGALKTGFAQARGHRVVFFDLDRTYFPEDVPLLVRTSLETGADVVMGARPFLEPGMPWIRTAGNLFFVGVARLLFRFPVRDLTTGFRVLKREVLPQVIALESEGFCFTMQLTLLSILRRWKVVQVPVQYEERIGDSKLSPLKDGFQFLWAMVRYRWLQIRSSPS